ncbi:hypothetical protein F383_14712 [Gossypium arboreum]|uniref:Uncharacterized protein n=1 Tax=Gossypium arboreum TaxID=29729 RepID=A0A0B0NIK1_GOSAR|nr:hypothetical protein F383_14712 [Gossypium arboreum]
MCCRKGFSLDE